MRLSMYAKAKHGARSARPAVAHRLCRKSKSRHESTFPAGQEGSAGQLGRTHKEPILRLPARLFSAKGRLLPPIPRFPDKHVKAPVAGAAPACANQRSEMTYKPTPPRA
jgi:hypothetical protein